MGNNNRKFDNETYEKLVASLMENTSTLQQLADSGLTYIKIFRHIIRI